MDTVHTFQRLIFVVLQSAPLLFISPTHAATVSFSAPAGTPGTLGLNGTSPPGPGGDGGPGSDAMRSLSTTDSANFLKVTAGPGGNGGAGGQTGTLYGAGGDGARGGHGVAHVEQSVSGSATAEAVGGRGGFGGDGASGGAGGDGGNAFASVEADVISGRVTASAKSSAGKGGNRGTDLGSDLHLSNAGDGGNAIAVASAITHSSDEARAEAVAFGGSGGGSFQESLPDVRGGRAIANAYAYSASGDARARASATGGGGGSGDSATTILVDAVRGAAGRTLYLEQSASGGSNGYGQAGDAYSSLTASNPLGGSISAIVTAGGGEVNSARDDAGLPGGNAFAEAHVTGSFVGQGSVPGARVYASGGKGGGLFAGTPDPSGAIRRAGEGGKAIVLPSSVTTVRDSRSGEVWLTTRATGGAGGDLIRNPSDESATHVGMMAGDGADVVMFNTVSAPGSDRIRLVQEAIGGRGGDGGYHGQAGNGGDASSELAISLDILESDVQVIATGGDAGVASAQDLPSLPVVKGGDSHAKAVVINDGGRLDLNGLSHGGNGNRLPAFYTNSTDDSRLGGRGGTATTDLLGQVTRAGSDIAVTGTAHGGSGAGIEHLPGALRGGEAGDAVSRVVGAAAGSQSAVNVSSAATGGNGATSAASNSDAAAIPRDGGTAEARATATNHEGRATRVTAVATGGNGGVAGGLYDGTLSGAKGGKATAFATAEASGGSPVWVTVVQVGGDGGTGFSGADGGDGAASHLLDGLAVVADGQVTIVHEARGGTAGDVHAILPDRDILSGDGGAASSKLTFNHSGDLDVTVKAAGGDGGRGTSIDTGAFRILTGHGGRADAQLDAHVGGTLLSQVTAIGGNSYSWNPTGAGPQGGEATARQTVSSSLVDERAEHRVHGLAVGGRLGGPADSASSASAASGTLTVSDVAFVYRSRTDTGSLTSRAEAFSSGADTVTADAQALVGDEYFSSVGDPFLHDRYGSLPPPAVLAAARADASAEGAGNVQATARVASLDVVDSHTSARAVSNGGLGAIAQADTLYEARGTTMVEAISSTAGPGVLRGVSVKSEAGEGTDLRAAASIATNGLIENPSLAGVDFALSAHGTNPSLSRTGSDVSITTLGALALTAELNPVATARATTAFTIDAGSLNPFDNLVVSYRGAGTFSGLTFSISLDSLSLWQISYDALAPAPLNDMSQTIELGSIGALMGGGHHDMLFTFDFQTADESRELDLSFSFGAVAATAVPVPPCSYAFATTLLLIAYRRRPVVNGSQQKRALNMSWRRDAGGIAR